MHQANHGNLIQMKADCMEKEKDNKHGNCYTSESDLPERVRLDGMPSPWKHEISIAIQQLYFIRILIC